MIPNGVSISTAQPPRRPLELQQHSFNLVVVGRLDTVKGINIAIESLKAKYFAPDIELHILGAGPLALELQKQAEELGICHRVHFLGFQRRTVDFIAYSDVFLMPSLHEGLP